VAVRLVDVAREAGVAPSTVSYVLSGNRPVSAETRRRVEASITQLGFRPHAGAQSLRGRPANVIALVLPLLSDGNLQRMEFVLAILEAAQAEGVNLLLLGADDGACEVKKVAGTAMVDGVIVMEIQRHDPRLPVLRSLERPVVLLGDPEDPGGMVHVNFNEAAAAALCVRHLYDLGHRHIGLLGLPDDLFEREAGYALRSEAGAVLAMTDHGLKPVRTRANAEPADVARALEDLFGQDAELSGLIVYNDKALPMVLERLRVLGRDVPADISVVAVCPDHLAQQMVPPVSAVTLPVEELGRLAYQRLATLIAGQVAPAETILEPRLNHRGSAGPPRRRTAMTDGGA